MAKMKKNNTHSSDKADALLKRAEELGLSDDYLFTTTLDRYRTQVDILNRLKAVLTEDGTLVTKEYVKGRGNLYTHPAITEYNKTVDSANKTVTTLDNLLKNAASSKPKSHASDPLLEVLGLK